MRVSWVSPRFVSMRSDGSSHVQGEGWSVSAETGGTRRRRSQFSADEGHDAPDLKLRLAARPENVSLVRTILGTLADSLGFADEVRDDLRLAVTEACTNVVRHAYNGTAGEIEVRARPGREGLEVVVVDRGNGGGTADTAGAGYGMELIAALADDVQIDRSAGEGSRLAMFFAIDRPLPEAA